MSVTLVLGQMLWADTRQSPQAGWGVAVEGDRVVATASHASLRARFPTAAVVEATHCIITPAFVNAHHHMYGVLAHGIPLEEAPAGFWPFLEDFWWPRVEDRLTHELIAAATDWACLEMIRSGVTTFYDCLEAPYALLRQAQDT
ncbi:MAG: amidohydrolase family protein, partial [Anaerolineae bacterium]|nr:amidohydrolase family protein [Anaerolineae bacterium]